MHNIMQTPKKTLMPLKRCLLLNDAFLLLEDCKEVDVLEAKYADPDVTA